jgi:hypothetical protein
MTVYGVETHQNELVDVHVMRCGRNVALTFTTAPNGNLRTTSHCVRDVHGKS